MRTQQMMLPYSSLCIYFLVYSLNLYANIKFRGMSSSMSCSTVDIFVEEVLSTRQTEEFSKHFPHIRFVFFFPPSVRRLECCKNHYIKPKREALKMLFNTKESQNIFGTYLNGSHSQLNTEKKVSSFNYVKCCYELRKRISVARERRITQK